MYTNEKKMFKAKVNGLYVNSISTVFDNQITLRDSDKFAHYLSEKEKDVLLKYFPDADIKELSITETEKSW